MSLGTRKVEMEKRDHCKTRQELKSKFSLVPDNIDFQPEEITPIKKKKKKKNHTYSTKQLWEKKWAF